nr:immunoglobulin light chain junction region [Macaca mulatta]MOY09254.1 immunoglobulin light chain junction region [Macaca mulatta]
DYCCAIWHSNAVLF